MDVEDFSHLQAAEEALINSVLGRRKNAVFSLILGHLNIQVYLKWKQAFLFNFISCSSEQMFKEESFESNCYLFTDHHMIYLALFECFELRINLLKQSRQRREELRLMELKAFDLTLWEVFLTNLTEVLSI